MRKFTQKQIREYITLGMAKDITDAESIDWENLETVGLSFGVYGMNAGLFKHRKTGEFFAVRSRCTNLFILA